MPKKIVAANVLDPSTFNRKTSRFNGGGGGQYVVRFENNLIFVFAHFDRRSSAVKTDEQLKQIAEFAKELNIFRVASDGRPAHPNPHLILAAAANDRAIADRALEWRCQYLFYES